MTPLDITLCRNWYDIQQQAVNMKTLGNLGKAAEKEAYNPKNGSGDTDPEEGMECESLLDNDEMENIHPSDAAAVSTAVAAACM